MTYIQRIIMGFAAGIGKMGPESQFIANKVSFVVGREIGEEMKLRGIISNEMDFLHIWERLNKELEIDPTAIFEEKGKEITITIKNCHICPKKVGKYPLPATACPIGGILRGVYSVLGKEIESQPELVPGQICKIVLLR
jgi:predicted hydrocarbon binding protein